MVHDADSCNLSLASGTEKQERGACIDFAVTRIAAMKTAGAYGGGCRKSSPPGQYYQVKNGTIKKFNIRHLLHSMM